MEFIFRQTLFDWLVNKRSEFTNHQPRTSRVERGLVLGCNRGLNIGGEILYSMVVMGNLEL